ncbi:MAG: hypothetical protein MPN21_18550 [Thermoanaerobaculia bacterium]|nr:hypothetical protein [Thermoanaerobaculia bacterium]
MTTDGPDMPDESWVILGMMVVAPLLPALHLTLLRWSRNIAALRWASGLHGLLCVVLLWTFGAATPRTALIVFSLWLTLCLGYLQVFSMLTRSISLRLLVELQTHPGATREDLFRDYAGERGFDWLQEKRLSGLTRLDLIRRSESGLTATRSGFVLGLLAVISKRVLALEDTG